jgi:endogenous inhibitor of DNA gyrase (YacG/DUF329 family)
MAAAKKCPICGKPPVDAFKPFCSKRCADVDLNRWLTGNYVIPARDDEPAADNDHPVSGDDDEF